MGKDLLGNPKEEKIKKKKSVPQKGLDLRKRDISKGIVVYVPKDDNIIPTNLPPVIMTEELAELDILLHAHMETGNPLLIRGPKGIAKTLKVAEFCKENEIPLIQIDCSEQMKSYDLLGRFVPVDDTVIYQLGVIPTAIELANEYGQAAICFEEFNTLTPNMQKVTNQLLDFRHHAYVPAVGRTFKVNEGCKLGIFATCNPSTYGGTFELNEDLYSRLTTFDMGYPEREEEINILNVLYEQYQDELGEMFPQFVTLAKETRHGYNKNEYSYALSTRDVCYLVANFIAYRDYLESISSEDPDIVAMGLVRKVFLSKYDVSDSERESVSLAWNRAMGDATMDM